MRTRLANALLLFLTVVVARADVPLRNADWGRHLSGPALAPSDLEGKVVLLEYFGYR